jgi:tetratricopeptide (TPR) repeat protein
VRRDYADAINNLGGVYVRLGQTKDAIAAFRYGIEVVPDNELLYLNLAGVYWSFGSSERAREILERLLARKPDSIGARRALQELEKP